MAKYHLRKKESEITDLLELKTILKNGKYATISMCRNNEPYIVTMNYGFDELNNILYFHSAVEGLKLLFLETNHLVCATVIQDLGYVVGDCNHRYRSVVFWGKLALIHNIDEKLHGLDVLFTHLETNPENFRNKMLADATRINQVAILRLDISEITGKEGL